VEVLICECGSQVEYLTGRSVVCRVCGKEHGAWTPHPGRGVPHVVGSYNPAVHVSQGPKGLQVIATRDLLSEELVERLPALWFNKDDFPHQYLKTMALPHPLNKAKNTTLSQYLFSAPLLRQCKVVGPTYKILDSPKDWKGSLLPLGLGVLYNHSPNPNLRWELEFIGFRLFVKFQTLSKISKGTRLSCDYGYATLRGGK